MAERNQKRSQHATRGIGGKGDLREMPVTRGFGPAARVYQSPDFAPIAIDWQWRQAACAGVLAFAKASRSHIAKGVARQQTE